MRYRRNLKDTLTSGALAALLLVGCGPHQVAEPAKPEGARPAEEQSAGVTPGADTPTGEKEAASKEAVSKEAATKESVSKDAASNGKTGAGEGEEGRKTEDLEENRIIISQTFDVNLEGWGEVRFVSYAPSGENPREDVRFYLIENDEMLYEFPNPWGGDDAAWTFDSVDMVSFQDVNQDGKKDVIALISYITGSGPQAAVPFPTTRIFLAGDRTFMLDQKLADEIDEHKANDSIASIMKYIEERPSSGAAKSAEIPANTPHAEGGESGESAAQEENTDDPMYEITGIRERDARAFLETFLAHVNAGEKEAAAKMILYPKKVFFPGKEVTVSSAEELLPYYDEIFTEEYKKRINDAMGDDLFWNYMGVMLGNGEIWLQETDGVLGISAVNSGEDRGAVYPGESGVQPG